MLEANNLPLKDSFHFFNSLTDQLKCFPGEFGLALGRKIDNVIQRNPDFSTFYNVSESPSY